MYLKVDIKIADNDYPPFFTDEEILDYINSKLRAELVDKIRDLQVIDHPDPLNLTDVQTEAIIIVNPQAFFDKLRDLHREKMVSTNQFISSVIDYVSNEKI